MRIADYIKIGDVLDRVLDKHGITLKAIDMSREEFIKRVNILSVLLKPAVYSKAFAEVVDDIVKSGLPDIIVDVTNDCINHIAYVPNDIPGRRIKTKYGIVKHIPLIKDALNFDYGITDYVLYTGTVELKLNVADVDMDFILKYVEVHRNARNFSVNLPNNETNNLHDILMKTYNDEKLCKFDEEFVDMMFLQFQEPETPTRERLDEMKKRDLKLKKIMETPGRLYSYVYGILEFTRLTSVYSAIASYFPDKKQEPTVDEALDTVDRELDEIEPIKYRTYESNIYFIDNLLCSASYLGLDSLMSLLATRIGCYIRKTDRAYRDIMSHLHYNKSKILKDRYGAGYTEHLQDEDIFDNVELLKYWHDQYEKSKQDEL